MGCSRSDDQKRRIDESALLDVKVDAGQGAPMELTIRKLNTVGTLLQDVALELGMQSGMQPEDLELELVLAGHVLAEMAATVESVEISDVSWECVGEVGATGRI